MASTAEGSSVKETKDVVEQTIANKEQAGDSASASTACKVPVVHHCFALSTVKHVHLIRHGEALHNAAFKERGEDAYFDPQFEDACLTPTGVEQAQALQATLQHHCPVMDVVLVSSATRALQTAHNAVGKHCSRYIVLECTRETFGLHPVCKRRKRTQLQADFPHYDFGDVASDEDPHWSTTRESDAALHKRATDFLHRLVARPERHIAVVSHNDFLAAFTCLPQLGAPKELQGPFANCELRSLALVLPTT